MSVSPLLSSPGRVEDGRAAVIFPFASLLGISSSPCEAAGMSASPPFSHFLEGSDLEVDW